MVLKFRVLTVSLISLFLILVCFSIFGFSQEIVYSSNKNGSFDIWVVNSDSTSKINLSEKSHDPLGEFEEKFPRWSPDGKRISFVSKKSGGHALWIMDETGLNDHKLTSSNLAEMNAFWSPDGNKIYYSKNLYYSSWSGCAPCPHQEIFVYDFVTGQETQLTFNNYREMEPVVSPDGTSIAYIKSERAMDCCNPTDIWIMNHDGTQQELLYGFSDGIYEWTCDWGEANNLILIGIPINGASASLYEIAYVDPENPNSITQLTFNNFYDLAFSFSPDGQKILFVSNRGGNYDLWTMTVDGSELLQLTDDSADERYHGDWKSISIDPFEQIENIMEELMELIETGTPAADKLEDVVAKLETALEELYKTPPDNQAAVGNIEGAVGDIEAAVKDGYLNPGEGTQLMDQLVQVAYQLAVEVIEEAIDLGGDPQIIAEAQQYIEEGDVLREAEEFKNAVNKYKDSLVKAESVLY